MTAFKRAEPLAYGVERAITASAVRLNIADRTEADRIRQRGSVSRTWQDEAWLFYDAIGEIKYAYKLEASVASRLRLYVGVVVDPDAPPVAVSDAMPSEEDDTGSTADDASDARREAEIDGLTPERMKEADDEFRRQMAKTNVGEMIRTTVLNLQVPGELYFVEDKGSWKARSTDEITPGTDKKWQVRRSVSEASGTNRYLSKQATVGRVWQPHPRYSLDPDSALLGMRSDCEELLLLSRMIRTITRSRLNAGFVYVPDEVSAVSRSTPEDGTEDAELEGDPLEQELLYAITEPINTENAAASVVPGLLRGPSDMADKIKHILFERKSDEFLVARADKVLDRILAGLDVPKDVVTGLANVKYSNAIQIDENLYKAHVEPLAVVICDAFTEIILHPILQARGWTDEELEKVVIWYDPSEVVVRPNRSEDADRGYDKYILSGAAWRDAHGFADTDAPSEDELAYRMAVDKAQVPPELATLLFNKLLPSITGPARQQAAEDGKVPPALQQMLDGEIPDSPAPAESADPNAAPPGAGEPLPPEPPAPAVDSEAPAPQKEPVP